MNIEILILMFIISVASLLPGIFLVLRGRAMMIDTISHSILLGIVIIFFITQDLKSPLLIIGASAFGLITAYLVELITKNKKVKEDSAMGIVFSLFFSIAIVLISLFANNIHLDIDSVLLGEVAFVPLNKINIFNFTLSKSIFVMSIILIINILYISLFYKELKLSTFDALYFSSLGFSLNFIHYSLMTILSITVVSAFDAVGVILVISLMIGPPITAFLLTYKIRELIISSLIIAFFNTSLGYKLAIIFDISIAGSIAVVTGLTFIAIMLLAPKIGIISNIKLRFKQKEKIEKDLFLVHLNNHKGQKNFKEETGKKTIFKHLSWSELKTNKYIKLLKKEQYIYIKENICYLSSKGEKYLENLKKTYNF